MYRLFFPVKVLFGRNVLTYLPKEIKIFGKKILFVCGEKSLKKIGLLDKVLKMFEENELEVSLFCKVRPEPTIEIVYEGLKFAESERCDCVVGMGGGSVIDVAKAIAGLYGEYKKNKNSFCVEDYLEVDGTRSILIEGLPFISVPTVAGTGAEVTMNSVLINSKTKNKRSIRSEYLFAKLSIIDPEITTTVPPLQTVISGVDALCHLIEGYISKKSNPICDILAIKGIEYVVESLPKVIKNPTDLLFRERLSIASLYGGIMIVNSGLTLAHGIGAVVGAKFKIPHGLACAVSLPEVIKLNLEYLPKNKVEIIKNLFTDKPDIFLEKFFSQIGIQTKLKVETEFNYEELAQQILNASSTKGNPKDVNLNEVVKILEKIFVKNL